MYLTATGDDELDAGLAALQGSGGVLALVAEADGACIARLQALAGARGIVLCGGLFPELLAHGASHKRGVVFLPLDETPVLRLVEGVAEGGEAALAAACDALGDAADRLGGEGREASLLLLFDGMLPNISTLLDAIYRDVGDEVRYFGANAGSETFRSVPCLFDNSRFVADAALLVLLADHAGAWAEHGYATPDEMLSATSTRGNQIQTIDWRPAFEAYSELVAKHHGVGITRDNFYRWAVHYPLGLPRMDGGLIVRIPVGLSEDGALVCIGEIPENALLCVLHASDSRSRDTLDRLAGHVDKTPSAAVAAFYCAGRRMQLGEQFAVELEHLARRFAPRPMFGALSLGEIGSAWNRGYPLFHNAAILCAPWSRA
ncbi:hypothetical protein MoryE10_10950 [Methylogaea oryzae]|uniref:Histidine kinase n=3 Tax=Methylogaea oryzae TaxID=1295382 RepID=A0A8D4VPW6_9GAMM|nr:hypothetical protein MoryE10_10950 [Methylogaea oryzae]